MDALRVGLIVVVTCVAPVVAVAQSDFLPSIPAGNIEVAVAPFASGLSSPIGGVDQFFATKMLPFPDGSGRNLISTFGGALRVVDSSGVALDAPLGGPYLDTTTTRTDIQLGAYGTTSVAIHPDFSTSGAAGFGKIYALVTEQPFANTGDYDFEPTLGSNNDHAEIVAEFTVAPAAIGSNRLLPTDVTRRDLFSVRQPDNEHNYGDLAFDENGLLYISAGDGIFEFNGGALYPQAFNSPDLSTPFGKILRIDPLGNNSANGQYGVPTGPGGNVFANDGDPNTLGEIFTYGHRNPFRISYDEPSGRLLIGDVGQFNIEEINVGQNGANYGWPSLEGTFLLNPADAFDLTLDADTDGDGVGQFAQANGLVEPVFRYDHQDGNSVTGGFVYRGSGIPALTGKYVFADLSRRLFAGDPDTGQFEEVNVVGGLGLPPQLLSFGTDSAGELYVIGGNGQVLALVEPAAAPDPELVNASFEDAGGSLDGWAAFFDIGDNIEVSDLPSQDGNALDGPNSLRMSGQFSGGFNFQGVFQGLAVEGGERIRASVSTLVRSLESIAGTDAEANLKIEYFDQFGGSVGGPEFLGLEERTLADGDSPEDVWRLGLIDDIVPAGAVEARFVLTFLQFDDGDVGAVHFDAAALTFIEPGDYNADGAIDGADYDLWAATLGQVVAEAGLGADGNRNGVVDAGDYTTWRDAAQASAVAVPEPTACVSLTIVSVGLGLRPPRTIARA